ncbi:hypothetical protein HDE78_000468 [Rhodanobacter sp. K2T2]|uniref:hypothetical protein n=1 Tax=Rhodanobacter sp. K2T2 TaxID=2723085 RepID=UPI0015CCBD62|nr:hypothetical protein [Rhodanobacter sp. K2T2]NYE27543.1 hypothetical protein [Rhodanobacter sp. K2T2]
METIDVSISIEEADGGAGPKGAVSVAGATIAELPGALSDLAFSNQVGSTGMAARSQVANQDAMYRLRQMILADAVNAVQTTSPTTARSAVTVFTSNELAREIAGLKASIEAFASP